MWRARPELRGVSLKESERGEKRKYQESCMDCEPLGKNILRDKKITAPKQVLSDVDIGSNSP